MRNILGLDIGTNSIGWALIEWDAQNFNGKITGMGSRIIPTDTELLSNYETGLAASKNAGRRQARGARRMQQRYKLRRHRLVETLKLLGWLPTAFEPGMQLPVSEQLLNEMKLAFGMNHISADWVVYYLRHKALTQAVSPEELARILYHMNQRRGFKSNRKANNDLPAAENDSDDDETARKKRIKTVEIVQVSRVTDSGEKYKGLNIFQVHLADGRVAQTLRKTVPPWMGETELELTWVPPTKKEPERWECRLPEKTDWQNKKEALEKDISGKGLTPGGYFFNELKKNPQYRVRESIIDRKYYEQEITHILNQQWALQPRLVPGKELMLRIAEMLYPHNVQKQQEIA
ncbi:MAG: hypothetical protein JNM68_14990, partial [Dinghuibacter sp.]|nr:hypothetical protein [Dinghuibacter sp.]